MSKQHFWVIGAAILALGLLTIGGLASCAGQEAGEQARIEAAVAATVANIPTQTPYPSPTISIPPTPVSLDGTFCEYGFCIGHPAEIYLTDAAILRNPAAPSAQTYGILYGFSGSLFMQVVWKTSGPGFDYGEMQKLILEEKDSLSGGLDVQLVGNWNVYYQDLNPTTSDLLPYGGVAAWQCGGRDFAWKAYTRQDGIAPGLLKQSLERFRCQ
jgi:hypothetical protein